MGAKTLTLASSHLPMLSHPGKVAAFVVEAAVSINASAAAWKSRSYKARSSTSDLELRL
jgi:hypothetical protein